MTADATRRIVVTGNGAFGDTATRRDLAYAENPSSEIAMRLDGEFIGGHPVQGVSLEWQEHPREVLDEIVQSTDPAEAPLAVIALGVFSGRPTVTVERIAANVRDFQFADGGIRPAGTPVFADGPTAYLATLPIKAIASSIREAGIPALVSNTASTHGCNSVMYTLLHRIAEAGLPTLAGFIHLPDPPAHVATLGSNGPSMSLDLQLAAVRTAIEATIAHGVDDIVLPANEWEW